MAGSAFRRLGTMIDCSRNAVMRPESVRRWAKLTSELGYNTLMLYTEDTYEIEGHPYFGYGRGRYTEDELRQIDAYCNSLGMELIPCIQTLAHLGALTHWDAFKPIIDTANILLVDDERTYALIEDMFRTLARCFTSRTVNIGMDEAHMVGLGKYRDLHGDSDRTELLLRHLEKVAEIGKKYGFTLLMWSDMFFRLASGGVYWAPDAKLDPAISAKIPENVQLIYWDYYSEDRARYDAMLAAHDRIKKGAWFAGGLWSWTGLCPHNAFSISTTTAAFAACRDAGVQDAVLTLWGDNGGECSRFTLLPALWYAAQLAKGEDDDARIRAGFAEKFGISFEDFLLLDLPGTGNDAGRSNPDKYLLYNDPFTGLLDSALTGTEAEAYRAVSGKLAAVDAGAFAPQFETALALSRVLEKKADLGSRIRAAYAAGDRDSLQAAAEDCDALGRLLDDLYAAFRRQWMQENKPQGFEVQDVRLGGLIRRIASCGATLRAYLNGEQERIEELEQPLLPYRGDFPAGQPLYVNNWGRIVTACVV